MSGRNGLLMAFFGCALGVLGSSISSGCSSTSTPDAADSGADDAAATDTSTRDPSKNCVKPGTPNNENGIGGYCEPGTSQCVTDAGIRLCTGAFDAPDDAWFCTKPCVDDPECGSGAYCDHDPRGSGCTPNICGNPPDAGSDSASVSDANDSGDAQGD
jgi:hypothetical protein